jgi:hypothetical protein
MEQQMSFDPQSYLNATMTGANATASKPVPVGIYLAVLMKPEIKTWQGKKDPTMSGIKLSFQCDLQDTIEGFSMKPSVRGEIMLDTDDSGALKFGDNDNVRLGRLRKAIGLNEAGKPWSFAQFEGRMLKVSVKHRVDPLDATKVYTEIDAYFPAA